MARQNKTKNKKEGAPLTSSEVEVAAQRMMAAAEAHHRASVWCREKPNTKSLNMDPLYFLVVSFELSLLSVEQSLRLVLLLHFSTVRYNTNHNPRAIYSEILHQSRGKPEIAQSIFSNMNAVAQANGLGQFSEKELQACLKKHDSSYSSLRYFQLDPYARLSPDWEITSRDRQIFSCLALALIFMNHDEMGKREIGALGAISVTPESEMTEELKALKERLTSH